MKNYWLVILLLISNCVLAQIKSPSEFLGYELGNQFTRHYQVIDYFEYIAENSSQVLFKNYGITNENRRLNYAIISSEENLKNIETIRTDNLKRANILNGKPTTNVAILWMSYNVHGNEASATEAALQTVYKLVTKHTNLLKNTVVIIDPCVNPDGRDRYVNWFYQAKNTPYNPNDEVREHQEPWPTGRPNHYLFDLNRDWAWATQVETQQRLKVYNQWLPHVHVDFHEQGYNSPYYFPPAAEPYHEIITNWQIEFQELIGKNHATYFNQNGWRYFTKESFDLFYPSYGDTYPTYLGAIGMTYEQAGHGRAGLGVITENGSILTLNERLTHHTTTSVSTVEVVNNNVSKLLVNFAEFYNNSSEKTTYVLEGESTKLNVLLQLLDQHKIDYFTPQVNQTIKGKIQATDKTINFKTELNHIAITTKQPKGKMVKVLFEKNAKLSDSLTYDITAWNLPMAYGLNCIETNAILTPQKVRETVNTSPQIKKPVYGYISAWNSVKNVSFLSELLKEEINVRYANKDFVLHGNTYKKGTLVILKNDNRNNFHFDEIIQEIATRTNTFLEIATTGFVENGPDFGSYSYKLIQPHNIALLGGDGTSAYNFGEIWHLFETQLNYPINVITTTNLNTNNLNNYDVLIIPSGFSASDKQFKILTGFIKNGGKVIAIASSINNFIEKDGFKLARKEKHEDNNTPISAYKNRYRNNITNQITGSIFNSEVDTSNPLAFGYPNIYYSLKLNATAYQLLPQGNVAYYPKNTTNIAGFAGYKALKMVPESLFIGTENYGKGKVIYFADNVLFRSFWENGKLFFANAVFLD